MPKDYPLAKCYRMNPDDAGGYDGDEANVHLLAALGKLETPFVPVHIRSGFDGYSWSTLPLVEKVEVDVGKELHSDWMWSGTLTCVDSLTITAHLSDGRVVSSPVCMAIAPESSEESPSWASDHVLVTTPAREKLRASEIWHHLGGFSDEGDTYETQEYNFEQDLDRFWAHVIGPDEHLRQSLLGPLDNLASDWKSVTMTAHGDVTIRYADGMSKVIQPPVCTDTSG